MPSHATYRYLPNADIINIDSQDGEQHIRIVADLFRIICRKAEISCYKLLQAELFDTLRTGAMTSSLVTKLGIKLGRIILVLRWRIVCWNKATAADQGDNNAGKNKERVEGILLTLYCHFCNLRRRFKGQVPERMLSSYANVQGEVEYKLPDEDTCEAYDQWISQAHDWREGARGPHLHREISYFGSC
jgi:hypothetical protein